MLPADAEHTNPWSPLADSRDRDQTHLQDHNPRREMLHNGLKRKRPNRSPKPYLHEERRKEEKERKKTQKPELGDSKKNGGGKGKAEKVRERDLLSPLKSLP